MTITSFSRHLTADHLVFFTAARQTFTKWFNSHLKRHEAAPAPIVDLYQDLRTGIKFFQLLNVIKNEGDPILVCDD